MRNWLVVRCRSNIAVLWRPGHGRQEAGQLVADRPTVDSAHAARVPYHAIRSHAADYYDSALCVSNLRKYSLL